MTKQEYKTYRRSMRDNGVNYTITHASKFVGWTLAKLDVLANMVDLLAWRAWWINQPDTSRKNIIKLTSFIL